MPEGVPLNAQPVTGNYTELRHQAPTEQTPGSSRWSQLQRGKWGVALLGNLTLLGTVCLLMTAPKESNLENCLNRPAT